MRDSVNYERISGDQQTGSRRELGADPYEHVDPFTYRPRMSALDWIKVIFNTLWLLPLRLFLIIIPSVVIGVIVCLVAIVGDRMDENNPRPLQGWRRFLMNTVARRLLRIILFGLGFHWISVRGTPAPMAEAPICVVSPHAYILDTIIVASIELTTIVGTGRVRSIPLFGYMILHAWRTIYIHRDDPSSRKQCTSEILRRAEDSAAGWPKILIFPEGTTHSTEVLLHFKKGAFLPGLPVQAVSIKYRNRVNTMVWGDRGQNIMTSLYLTLCQFHNRVEVEFYPVHHPTSEERDNPELYAESVRGEISQALGIPTSMYSIEDMLICRRAEKLGLPYPTGLVSYPTVRRELRLSMSDIVYWLQRFSSMDRDRDGLISGDDMWQYLAAPNDACTQTVFKAISKGSVGRLNFRHYLYGVVGLSLPFTTDEALRNMFQFFDTEGKGQVTLADISSRLPVQWTNQSDLVNDRGSPSPKHGGCGLNLPDHTSFPDTMTYDQFRSAMLVNLEYLLLYHECQGAVLSSSSSHDNTTPTQLMGVTTDHL